jgi:hypothetical protein
MRHARFLTHALVVFTFVAGAAAPAAADSLDAALVATSTIATTTAGSLLTPCPEICEGSETSCTRRCEDDWGFATVCGEYYFPGSCSERSKAGKRPAEKTPAANTVDARANPADATTQTTQPAASSTATPPR